MDEQTTEIIGRNRLVEQLFEAGIEVAFPVRDRGIDMIAYIDTGEQLKAFVACPIQLKVASDRSFSFDQKYEKFPNILHVFVWGIGSLVKENMYALTHQEVIGVGERMGYTNSKSWKSGRYSSSSPSKKLVAALDPYRMTPEKWRQAVGASQQL